MAKDCKYDDYNQWMASNAVRVDPYCERRIGHASLDMSTAMHNIAHCIKNGDSLAVAIGLDLLAKDPVMPFGKTIKSQILNALRANAPTFGTSQWNMLGDLREKWADMKPFPPREMRYLEKLLKLQTKRR